MIRLFNDPFFCTAESVFESVNNVITKPRSVINKTDNGYKLSLVVPGLTKDDLKIVIKERKLTISYQNEDDHMFVDNFTKSYFLPDDIIEKKISAEVKNGVLLVDLPITDKESTEKVIEVK
jgi:HSP20 family molecular chaperone IbpA